VGSGARAKVAWDGSAAGGPLNIVQIGRSLPIEMALGGMVDWSITCL